MSRIYLMLNEIIFMFNEVAIYLIFGLFIAGILHLFFPENFIVKHIGKNNFSSVIKSSLLGIPIPICSCGVIPVAASLRKKGASKGATVAFLISTPQIGADSFMITYSLVGWIFGIFRIIAAFVTAMVAGITTNIFSKKEDPKKEDDFVSKTNENTSTVKSRFHNLLSYIQYELFASIAGYMLFGVVLAAAISAFIPQEFFELYMGNQFLSMIIMLAIGIPMYICASSSTPIAAALMLKGLSPGAALVFLLAGPATNAITISTVTKTLGKTVTVIYLVSISVISLLLGWILNYVALNTSFPIVSSHQHEILPLWLKLAGSALLLVMFLVHYYNAKIVPLLIKKKLENKKSVSVNGMTCAHCSANVKKAVENIKETEGVVVSLEDSKVYYKSSENIHSKVKKAIEEAGFEINLKN